MVLADEFEADCDVLTLHLRAMIGRLRKLPVNRWDWAFEPSAPTARAVATHALAWLQCDRQHIENPDAKTHRPTPTAPTEPAAICDALDQEREAWQSLLSRLTDADLGREGFQFGHAEAPMNVRGFIMHSLQNTIYKHGQLATIYFALDPDGEGPYEAPMPNAIYRDVLGIN